jgi:hypothetical protein
MAGRWIGHLVRSPDRPAQLYGTRAGIYSECGTGDLFQYRMATGEFSLALNVFGPSETSDHDPAYRIRTWRCRDRQAEELRFVRTIPGYGRSTV